VSAPSTHIVSVSPALVVSAPTIIRSSTGQIYVKRLNRKTIELQVSRSDTIYALKEMIQDKKGFLPDQQCLTFAGEGFGVIVTPHQNISDRLKKKKKKL